MLAPNGADRAQIVPGPKQPAAGPAACGTGGELTPSQRRHRLAWAVLRACVFRLDVTLGPDCGGSMKIVAALTDPRSIRTYLEGVGLDSCPPPIAPARPDLQPSLDSAA